MMNIIRTSLSALAGVPLALLYGLLVRMTFDSNNSSTLLSTLTCGFLFIVPLAMGALTVWLAPREFQRSMPYATLAPWVSVIIVAFGSIALYLEAAICIVMAMPIFFALSSLGGFLVSVLRKNGGDSSSFHNTLLGIVLLAPYIVTPFEMRAPVPETHYSVENQIRIYAPPGRVWNQLISISRMSDLEQDGTMFHRLGIPRLIDAPLSHDGVGGTRIVGFENGLSFVETITTWDEFDEVIFSVRPNPHIEAPAPFNMVGGDAFSVDQMHWWLEDGGDGSVILHLRSRHRLSTHLNSYAAIWTRLMLANLQDYVLQIMKERAESSS